MTKADAMVSTMVEDLPVGITSEKLGAFVSHLQGTILTIIDASYTDREQREAVKSLVRNALWDNTGLVVKWMSENAKTDDKTLSTFPF